MGFLFKSSKVFANDVSISCKLCIHECRFNLLSKYYCFFPGNYSKSPIIIKVEYSQIMILDNVSTGKNINAFVKHRCLLFCKLRVELDERV